MQVGGLPVVQAQAVNSPPIMVQAQVVASQPNDDAGVQSPIVQKQIHVSSKSQAKRKWLGEANA